MFIERYDVPQYPTLFGAATLAVTASIVVHSLTATPGVLYARRRRSPPLPPRFHDMEER